MWRFPQQQKDNDGHLDTESSKTWFHTYSYDYNKISICPNMHFNPFNVGNATHFDGIRYTDWVYQIKMHLVSLHTRIWKIMNVGALHFRMWEER